MHPYDGVILLRNGEVVAEGFRDELQKCSAFADLWKHIHKCSPNGFLRAKNLDVSIPDSRSSTAYEPTMINIPPPAIVSHSPSSRTPSIYSNNTDINRLRQMAEEVQRNRLEREKMERIDHTPPTALPASSRPCPVHRSSNPFANSPFRMIVGNVFPTIPDKGMFCFGLLACALSGALTPVFSFVLSHLMVEVSHGAKNLYAVNFFGGLVLGFAALDAFMLALKFTLMETCAVRWVTRIRTDAFKRILRQRMKWFGKVENSPVKLVQVIGKTGGDTQNFLSVVFGQATVTIAMFMVGFVWAMVTAPFMALVGLAIVPVFILLPGILGQVIMAYELRTRVAKDNLGQRFFEVRTIYYSLVNLK
jgi:ATP-binding cassette, subfamily B (MDR/TAP), member 1